MPRFTIRVLFTLLGIIFLVDADAGFAGVAFVAGRTGLAICGAIGSGLGGVAVAEQVVERAAGISQFIRGTCAVIIDLRAGLTGEVLAPAINAESLAGGGTVAYGRGREEGLAVKVIVAAVPFTAA